MISKFEKSIYETLHNNSIVFLKDGVERLIQNDNDEVDFIHHDLLILTCVSFQTSLELASKALIVERSGIRSILNSKQRALNDHEIENLFLDNNLKTLDFEYQKNFIKTKKYIYSLTREDFISIETFQKYRNNILHLSYKFADGDYYDLKEDAIFYMINIIFKILLSNSHEDVKPSEFVIEILGAELYKSLITYKPYLEAIKRIAMANSKEVFNCIFCSQRTFAQDQDYCYCCNSYYEDNVFTDCAFCNKKRSIIFDDLNIKLNFNSVKGLCLNCDNDFILYKCPDCKVVYNLELDFGKKCAEDYCINCC